MKLKLYWFFVSIAVSLLLVVNLFLPVRAVAFTQDDPENGISTDLAEEVNEIPSDEQDFQPEYFTSEGLSDGELTFLEPPYLSDDGNALHNVVLPRVLIADPNPEMQNLRFPQDPEIAAAIAGTRSAGATFAITYVPAGNTDPWGKPCLFFPTAARTAFDAAAAIWASRIQSSVPITISACWSNALGPGVLGYSGGGRWDENFSNAPMANTRYLAALANSFAGVDLRPSDADMHITYSSTFTWYYGTDGLTPPGTYDLVTVAAHEIAHGLNFAGTVQYSSGSARYGYGSGFPSIYERFMESGGATKLTSYANPSTALGTLVTSNNLWWNGTHANAANGGGRVKMYAPSTWSPGSSYSHLDYATYAGTINSMMVFAIGWGTSQHNPGPVTMGILKDMGWQEFTSGPHLLTVNRIGTGTGTVTSSPDDINCGSICSALFSHGTTVTLTANPIGDSVFVGWSGAGCSGTGTCQVTMTQAITVTATFSGPSLLTVNKLGAGTGTVTSNPAGIDCGATCSAPFSHGVTVTLTANPMGDSTFAGWSGSGCSGTGTCQVTMTQARSVTTFFRIPGEEIYYYLPLIISTGSQ